MGNKTIAWGIIKNVSPALKKKGTNDHPPFLSYYY